MADASGLATRESRTKGRDATTGVIPGRFCLSVGIPDLPEPEGWRWTLLSDVAQLESGHTPSRQHPEYWDGGVPWIGIRDAVDNHGRTVHETYQHVSELGLANSSARLLPPRTVCLSRTASVGYVVVMGCSMSTSQDFVNWVCGPQLEPDYLKYVLLSERESLFQFASGTTHQTIYYPEAKAFAALLPPPREQKAILSVLQPLDDKVESNRRMNATLEAMSHALFKSWFVDFEPLRAKMSGHVPRGLNSALLDLFPKSFESSVLGEIPRGWRIAPLGELLELHRGFDLPTAARRPGSIPIVSSSGVSGYHDEAKVPGPGVVTGRYGTIGQVFLVWEPFWPLNTSLFISDFKNTDVFYALYLLRTLDFEKFSDKGAVPGINRNDVHLEPVCEAPRSLQLRFREVVEPLLARVRRNEEESRTLQSLRDSLLPRLLSGALRVRDAEHEVGRVA